MKNKYRMLRAGEIIKPADEVLDDNCESWTSIRAIQEACEGILVGIEETYSPALFVPMRRLIEE